MFTKTRSRSQWRRRVGASRSRRGSSPRIRRSRCSSGHEYIRVVRYGESVQHDEIRPLLLKIGDHILDTLDVFECLDIEQTQPECPIGGTRPAPRSKSSTQAAIDSYVVG